MEESGGVTRVCRNVCCVAAIVKDSGFFNLPLEC